MVYKKLACLAAAAVVGASLMAVPAQAGFGGFGGMHVAAFAGMRVGGFGGGFVGRSAFVGRPAFINHGLFPAHRFAFFPHRRFIAPFFGVGALAAYSSCGTWVPTAYGWRRVWACDSDYRYGYY